jgi:hypothetical protein
MMGAFAGQSERGHGITLILSLMAASCAAMGAVGFVTAWREEDLVVTLMLGAAFLALVLVALVFVRASS